MHILSDRNRSEFLAVPQLVRFTVADGSDGREATLLIKSSTLTLKYLLRLKRFRLMLMRISERWAAYCIQIEDDPDHPATLWCLLEYADEREALATLSKQPRCFVFLFNELAINVAWAEINIDLSDEVSQTIVNLADLHPPSETEAADDVSAKIESLYGNGFRENGNGIAKTLQVSEWNPMRSHYITNRVSSSLVAITDADDGGQQEELALWLIDNLQPAGAVKSPQIHEPKARELSDLLLSHEHGAFLIESKTLSIIARAALPNRAKLTRDIVKHLQKATSQLIGGVKNLRRGHRITDLDGRDIEVERTKPPHVIVLVPDLSLLSSATEFGGNFIRKSSAETGGFLHILDLSELLRVVQAAEMISRNSTNVSPIMAFDYYLMKRAEHALNSKTPYFEVLLRLQKGT